MRLPEVSARVATAGLIGLAALDVVLVGMALGSTRSSGVDERPLSKPSASIDSTGVRVKPSPAAVATSRSPSPSSVTAAQVAPLRILLAALDNQRAWRASAGSCSGGEATLSTTLDGGRTWVPRTPPLRTIVRVQPADGRAAFVIGADSSCSAKLRETSDGADSWGAAGSVGGAWFRDPKNPRTVGAPGSTASQPCGKKAVLDLAALSGEAARVLCADGLVRSSTDTGSSWTDSGTVAGAVALGVLSAKPAQTHVARLHAPGCAGVQIMRVSPRGAVSCIRSALPKQPGQIAMSLVKRGGWLVVGDTTMRSTDDLVTWSAS